MALLAITIAACRYPSASTQTSGDSVISFCDLVRTPDTHNGQTVRVRGVLIGYHETALYDAACDPNVKYIRADFDGPSRRKLVDAISGLCGAGLQRGNFWADVVLTGRFEKLPDSDCTKTTVESGVPGHNYVHYCYRLVVSDVSQVIAVSPNVEWPK